MTGVVVGTNWTITKTTKPTATLEKSTPPSKSTSSSFPFSCGRRRKTTTNHNEDSSNSSKTSSNSNNDPKIAFVAFSHLKDNSTKSFDTFIFPSLQTWLYNYDGIPYFVILNKDYEQTYHDMCNKYHQRRQQHYYCNRIQPIFVDCNDSNNNPSCKQEQGLLYLYEHCFGLYDWYTFHDDDVYFRLEFLRNYLRPFTKTTTTTTTTTTIREPIIATSGPIKQLGLAGHPTPKIRSASYKCESNDENYKTSWGMPVIYSSQALHYISNGLRLHGINKQGIEYDCLDKHDMANGIFHWMYSLPTIIFDFPFRPYRKTFHYMKYGTRKGYEFQTNHIVGFHGMNRSHTDKQNVTIMLPSMYEIHQSIHNIPRKNSARNLSTYRWLNSTGFHQTLTYKNYGHPKNWNHTWHVMPKSDCLT